MLRNPKNDKVILELTEEEAESLLLYLGLHSISSSLETYPIFEKLQKIIDPDCERPEFSPDNFISFAGRTEISSGGLLFTVKPLDSDE